MKTDEFLTKLKKRHKSITENNQLLKVLENTEPVFNSIKAKLIEQGFENLKVNIGDWSPLYKKVMFYINYSNKFSYEQTKVIKKLSSAETIDQIKITIEDDIWEYNTEDLSAEGTVTFKIECPYSEKISNKDAEVIANIFVDKVKSFINKIDGESMKTNEFLNEIKKILNESSQKNEDFYSDNDETKKILLDLIEKGFKPLFDYWVDYNGRGEECYRYDEIDNDKRSVLENDITLKIEDNSRILLYQFSDYDSGDYPSGGSDADHITYSTYYIETRGAGYFYPEWNKELNMNASEYVVQNYPESKLAKLITEIGLVNIDTDDYYNTLIEDLKQKDF